MSEIEQIPSENLIGRKVSFVLKPELKALIDGVEIAGSGRLICVTYFVDDEVRNTRCNAFELQLEP